MSEATTADQPGADQPGVEADDTNATTIVVIGLVSTVLLLCSVLGVTALYDAAVSSLNKDRVIGAQYSASETAVAEQDNQLYGSPRAVNAAAGVYSIPIDHAMTLVVQEMNSKQSPE